MTLSSDSCPVFFFTQFFYSRVVEHNLQVCCPLWGTCLVISTFRCPNHLLCSLSSPSLRALLPLSVFGTSSPYPRWEMRCIGPGDLCTWTQRSVIISWSGLHSPLAGDQAGLFQKEQTKCSHRVNKCSLSLNNRQNSFCSVSRHSCTGVKTIVTARPHLKSNASQHLPSCREPRVPSQHCRHCIKPSEIHSEHF